MQTNQLLPLQTIMHKLPPFLRDDVRQSPVTGNGVHTWLLRFSMKLHNHLTPEEIFSVLHQAVRNCGRRVPDQEIINAIETGARFVGKPIAAIGDNGVARASCVSINSRWPDQNPVLIRKVLAQEGTLSQLAGASSDTHEVDTEGVIDLLFPPDALLCCGTSAWRFDTKPRAEWRGHLDKQQFIVPSPMSARHGQKKDGTGLSAHTLNNTGPRRFLVVEFDQGSLDHQAALHLHLLRQAPLVMAVYSGRKSLHGWYYCQNVEETLTRHFFEFAVRLGADSKTWTRSQFVRMPWGLRTTPEGAAYALQPVLYFNPGVVK